MGKKKGPPLTKQEKLERKRARKLLLKERKAERLRQIKRDYLLRELKYCQINREKYEAGWKKTLSDLKLQELHIDYRFHVNNSARVLDAKDMEISILLDELDSAEEQYEFNLQKYVINFDTIVDALDQSLNHLKKEYDGKLAELLGLANVERTQHLNAASERELNLKLVLFGLEKNRQIKTNVDKAAYLSLIQEEEDMSMAEIELRQASLESRFEQLWRAYKETINEYKRENGETKKKYDVVFNQDKFMRKWIKQQTRQLFKAYDKIYQLKYEQAQEKDAIDLQLQSKMDEHEFFLNSFHSLKRKLKEDLNKDDEQSKAVVKYCNESIHKLTELRTQGEYILKINGICRKFETAEELVMPYPEFEPSDLPQHTYGRLGSSDQVKLYREKRMLDMFLQRSSQGDALRNFLYEEYEHGRIENARMKQKLRGHCQSTELPCINIIKTGQKKKENQKLKCTNHYTIVKN